MMAGRFWARGARVQRRYSLRGLRRHRIAQPLNYWVLKLPRYRMAGLAGRRGSGVARQAQNGMICAWRSLISVLANRRRLPLIV